MRARRPPVALALVALLGRSAVARADDASTAPPPVTTDEQDEDYPQVRVRGAAWASPRGVGDTRVKRELLEASPRQQTSELLSAAPGFFVDHEDGEGLGNDVFLRGFDLEHGSGIEMKLGAIPLNVPLHLRGQGYADVSFVIPEVVRSLRVLEGPYDPRQGDAAIVGSAYLDLGVEERGYRVKASGGSFGQARLLGIAAPPGADPETFTAVALRRSGGFGVHRASRSGSAMSQTAFELGSHDRLRVLATAYAARSELAGVVRQDDVDAGRIAFDGTYPYFAENQGVTSSRLLLGVDLDHDAPGGAHLELTPWVTFTSFRARQNYDGALESSQEDPRRAGLGDLWETRNRELAAGLGMRYRPPPLRLGLVEVALEPGLASRFGHTSQAKSLLVPSTLAPWDRRIAAAIDALDLGGYVDLDVRLARRVRVSGGARADVLGLVIDDRLAGVRRQAAGVAAGPRVSLEVTGPFGLVPVVSYGEGFRSLGVERLPDGSTRPYAKVRSAEAGVRATLLGERLTATAAAFETWVEREQVFEAEAGGLETQRASTRRGLVVSAVARPTSWLLVSSALSATRARYDTNVAGVAHFVPSVPPVLARLDATARAPAIHVAGERVVGRVGLGYTYLARRHLTDDVLGPPSHVLNATVGARIRDVELAVDGYNVLDLRYADEAAVYASNWSFRPGQQLASVARHVTAAPPLSVVASVTVVF